MILKKDGERHHLKRMRSSHPARRFIPHSFGVVYSSQDRIGPSESGQQRTPAPQRSTLMASWREREAAWTRERWIITKGGIRGEVNLPLELVFVRAFIWLSSRMGSRCHFLGTLVKSLCLRKENCRYSILSILPVRGTVRIAKSRNSRTEPWGRLLGGFCACSWGFRWVRRTYQGTKWRLREGSEKTQDVTHASRKQNTWSCLGEACHLLRNTTTRR